MKKLLLLSLLVLSGCAKEASEPEIPQYTLTVTANPEEGGLVNPQIGTYNAGETITIVASSNSNFYFKNWSGDWNGETETLTLTIDNNKVLVANFEKLVYLDSNGITLKASSGAKIGTEVEYNGDTYIIVSEEQLRNLVNNNQDISKVITTKVTDMSSLFNGKDINGNISSWDVSNVTSMYNMFIFSDFNQDISDWDVSSVTNMRGMFYDTPFNQPIGNWDVSSVTYMKWLFRISKFNQPIGNWDVSNVTNMALMFIWSYFNQDISNWNVSNVSDCLWFNRSYVSTTGNYIGGYLTISNFPNFTNCYTN